MFDLEFKKEILTKLGYSIHEVRFLNEKWDERYGEWISRGVDVVYLVYVGEYPDELMAYVDGEVATDSNFKVTTGSLSKYNLEEVFESVIKDLIRKLIAL